MIPKHTSKAAKGGQEFFRLSQACLSDQRRLEREPLPDQSQGLAPLPGFKGDQLLVDQERLGGEFEQAKCLLIEELFGLALFPVAVQELDELLIAELVGELRPHGLEQRVALPLGVEPSRALLDLQVGDRERGGLLIDDHDHHGRLVFGSSAAREHQHD